MGAILTLKASWMLIYGLCEGVFVLRKITITVDEGTLECLRVFRDADGISYSALIRRAVLSYYLDKFCTPSDKKK